MLASLSSLLLPAARARLLLLLNHVVAAEPAALERLRRHAGRRVEVDLQAEPGPWPQPPGLCLRVTPAGLFEESDPAAGAQEASVADAELRVRIDLPAPHRLVAQWIAGQRPAVTVEGDAQFAADLAWLGEHLRWDVAGDLARVVGPGPAHELVRVATSLLQSLRQGAGAVQSAAGAWGGAAPPQPSR